MTSEQEHLARLFKRLGELQGSKGDDYAGEDRLDNFKIAGAVTGISNMQQCLSMDPTWMFRESLINITHMDNPKLFEYAILWHPTDKQIKDEGLKSVILVYPIMVLSTDIGKAGMAAAMAIPADKRDQLDQVEIAIRPF